MILKIDDFTAGNGWLEKFINRHSLIFKSFHGKANVVDKEMR